MGLFEWCLVVGAVPWVYSGLVLALHLAGVKPPKVRLPRTRLGRCVNRLLDAYLGTGTG